MAAIVRELDPVVYFDTHHQQLAQVRSYMDASGQIRLSRFVDLMDPQPAAPPLPVPAFQYGPLPGPQPDLPMMAAGPVQPPAPPQPVPLPTHPAQPPARAHPVQPLAPAQAKPRANRVQKRPRVQKEKKAKGKSNSETRWVEAYEREADEQWTRGSDYFFVCISPVKSSRGRDTADKIHSKMAAALRRLKNDDKLENIEQAVFGNGPRPKRPTSDQYPVQFPDAAAACPKRAPGIQKPQGPFEDGVDNHPAQLEQVRDHARHAHGNVQQGDIAMMTPPSSRPSSASETSAPTTPIDPAIGNSSGTLTADDVEHPLEKETKQFDEWDEWDEWLNKDFLPDI